MQFTTLATLLVAAAGINAAPALEKRLEAIPLSIYSGLGCNSNPIPLTTACKCFGISPIVSGNTDSAIIDQVNLAKLPTGCTRKL
jgi:hypothetical protein